MKGKIIFFSKLKELRFDIWKLKLPYLITINEQI